MHTRKRKKKRVHYFRYVATFQYYIWLHLHRDMPSSSRVAVSRFQASNSTFSIPSDLRVSICSKFLLLSHFSAHVQQKSFVVNIGVMYSMQNSCSFPVVSFSFSIRFCANKFTQALFHSLAALGWCYCCDYCC